MQYLDKYNSFNEANEEPKGNEPKRSERVLNQAQREWKDDSNIEQTDSIPTILFTDVVGSSKMWSDDAQSMSAQLREHHKLVAQLAEKYSGWIVKTIGDAFMIYFESSKDSLLNAVKFSKDLIRSERKYKLRIGICSGNMEQRTYRIQKVDLKDFYGNAVNTASRMESKVAEENGIAFTSTRPISNGLKNKIKKQIGDLQSVDASKLDLRGVTVKEAYRIKVR